MEKIEKKTGRLGCFSGWFISALLILVLAWGFVSAYPRITKEAKIIYSQQVKEDTQKQLEEYVEEVYPLIEGMYVEWYNKNHPSKKSAGEIILGEHHPEYTEQEDYLDWYALRSENLSSWNKVFYLF